MEGREDFYRDQILDISEKTYAEMCYLFPDIDVLQECRYAAVWLRTCAASRRPKNIKRFICNWMKKADRDRVREGRKQELVNRELRVGEGPRG